MAKAGTAEPSPSSLRHVCSPRVRLEILSLPYSDQFFARSWKPSALPLTSPASRPRTRLIPCGVNSTERCPGVVPAHWKYADGAAQFPAAEKASAAAPERFIRLA